MTMMPELRVHA